MKYLLFVLVIIFNVPPVFAQDKKEYETEVLKNTNLAKKVEPTEKICFDRRFMFVSKTGSRHYEGCFYVDTKGGITASRLFTRDGSPECSFDIHSKRFQLLLFGMKGNEYIYFNRSEKVRPGQPEVLKHYVQTGNTHVNPLTRVLEGKVLYNKRNSEEFVDGKYKALEYKSADGKSTLYLYGKDYPDEVIAYSYLGAFGLGYLKCNKGNFLVLKFVHGNTEFSLTRVEDLSLATACFDPSNFKVFEETKVVALLEESEQSNQNLDRQIAKQQDRVNNSNTPCAVKKLELLQYKKEEEEKKKRLLQKMKDQRNAYSDPATIQALAKEYSFIEGIKMERRQIEYDLCILKTDVEKGRYKAGTENHAKAMQKISCWERKVEEYKKYEDDIKQIDQRNRNDVNKAAKEKGEYYKNNILPKMGDLRCR